MLLLSAPWMFWWYVAANPDSTFSLVLSFIPPMNEFVILVRLASFSPPPVWAGLAQHYGRCAGGLRRALGGRQGVPCRFAHARQAAEPGDPGALGADGVIAVSCRPALLRLDPGRDPGCRVQNDGTLSGQGYDHVDAWEATA